MSRTCTILPQTTSLHHAFSLLRKGYPDLPFSVQSHGKPFRSASRVITDALVQTTLEKLSTLPKNRIVVLMPWRAGLAFAEPFGEYGIDRFYHVSARRDEETLQTMVDYENGDLHPDDTVIIADPMLATGNTSVDSMKRMAKQGIPPDHIILTTIIAAPEGIAAARKFAPSVEIIVGALDEKLDANGFIVPGLGYFGDKYFADMNAEETNRFLQELQLPKKAKEKLRQRFASHTK